MVPLQVEVPKVSPQMQSSMRTNQSKGLKRGRKKGRKGKGKGKFARSNSKLRVLKDSKTNKGNKTNRSKKANKEVTKETEAPKKRQKVTTQEDSHQQKPRRSALKNGGSKERQQNRFHIAGKGWAYEVLPDQKLGCSNCRFIFNGCRNCSKAGFRGKSAAQMRLEQQQVLSESWDGYVWDENLQDWVWDQSAEPTKPKVQKRGLNKSKGTKESKEPKTSKRSKKNKWSSIVQGWMTRTLACRSVLYFAVCILTSSWVPNVF